MDFLKVNARSMDVDHSRDLVAFDDVALAQFADEYNYIELAQQTSPDSPSMLVAVDDDDKSEYNLSDGREIMNEFDLEIGKTITSSKITIELLFQKLEPILIVIFIKIVNCLISDVIILPISKDRIVWLVIRVLPTS